MVGFGVWLFEACFILFHFCKEECWISSPAPLQTLQSKHLMMWEQSSPKSLTSFPTSGEFPIFGVITSPQWKPKNSLFLLPLQLSLTHMIQALPEGCSDIGFKASVEMSHMRKPTMQNPFSRRGGNGGIQLSGAAVAWAVLWSLDWRQ